jgi:hypothetical protein
VASAKICLDSGKLAGDLCTNTTTEVFIAGTEPLDKCDLHTVQAQANPGADVPIPNSSIP